MPCLLSEVQKKNHVTCEFSGYKQNVIPDPPCSPDLVPCDVFLYPKLKMVLKGGNFNDITKIQAKLLGAIAKLQAVNFEVLGCIVRSVGLLYKDLLECKALISK
jgi:hypothetical protein